MRLVPFGEEAVTGKKGAFVGQASCLSMTSAEPQARSLRHWCGQKSVEPRGFEPLTSGLQSRRSPN
jgi:hypothetical protein